METALSTLDNLVTKLDRWAICFFIIFLFFLVLAYLNDLNEEASPKKDEKRSFILGASASISALIFVILGVIGTIITFFVMYLRFK